MFSSIPRALQERESQLSRDLDRFKNGRRLLLTGTPLQNELRELWNLLNLLLPEVGRGRRVLGWGWGGLGLAAGTLRESTAAGREVLKRLERRRAREGSRGSFQPNEVLACRLVVPGLT